MVGMKLRRVMAPWYQASHKQGKKIAGRGISSLSYLLQACAGDGSGANVAEILGAVCILQADLAGVRCGLIFVESIFQSLTLAGCRRRPNRAPRFFRRSGRYRWRFRSPWEGVFRRGILSTRRGLRKGGKRIPGLVILAAGP